MEIMKKNLRSVKRNSEGRYEYFRLDAEEAMQLVDAGTHIFISKEEYKRQSKFYSSEPCEGTLVNKIAEDGTKYQTNINGINYQKRFNQDNEFPSSTKIAKCSSQIKTIRRRNKYAISYKTIVKRTNKLLKAMRSLKRKVKLIEK